MTPDHAEVWTLGSRSGSLAALVLFGAIFATLGAGVGMGLRRSGGWSRRAAWIAGALFTGVLLLLFWRSTLGGFYEAELRDDRLALYGLASPWAKELPLESIDAIKAVPAFKVSWRVQITTGGGGRYESATSSRAEAEKAAGEMGRRLPRGGR